MSDRRFRSNAYTGRRVKGAVGDLVIDLDGLSTPWAVYPILRQHDANRIAGQSDRQERVGHTLMMQGAIFNGSPAGYEVITLADSGFKWQSSVGVEVNDVEAIPEGKTVKVNGMVHDGPLIVIRKATLRELSAVPAGADGDTTLDVLPV